MQEVNLTAQPIFQRLEVEHRPTGRLVQGPPPYSTKTSTFYVLRPTPTVDDLASHGIILCRVFDDDLLPSRSPRINHIRLLGLVAGAAGGLPGRSGLERHALVQLSFFDHVRPPLRAGNKLTRSRAA